MASSYSKTATVVYTFSVKIFSILTITLLLFSSVFLFNFNSAAQELICPLQDIEQITDDQDEDSFQPDITPDGNLVAFSSRANINGTNPTNTTQIYVFNNTTKEITMETDFDRSSVLPSISADGSRIAFRTNANINGGNPDENREIYVLNKNNGTFIQVTNTPENSSTPYISKNGLRVAFSSSADINGGNPDGSFEAYVYDIPSGITTQITDSSDPSDESFADSINGDGTIIGFNSTADIGGNNPEGNSEAYYYDTTTDSVFQITNEVTGNSSNVEVSHDGIVIAFISSANIDGLNPGATSNELYLYEIATGEFKRITFFTNFGISSPSINSDGSVVAFRSRENINGGNPQNNNDIFIVETDSGEFTQLTFTDSGFGAVPSINGDGLKIAFNHDDDINGNNPDEVDQVYLACCFDRFEVEVPTLSEWGLIAMATVLGIVGFTVFRRRKVTA